MRDRAKTSAAQESSANDDTTRIPAPHEVTPDLQRNSQPDEDADQPPVDKTDPRQAAALAAYLKRQRAAMGFT